MNKEIYEPMDDVKRSRFTFEVGFIYLTMTTQQIRAITSQATLLLEKIDELNSYIEQLTNGVMSTLGSKESNKQAIQEYNMRIINLETELQQIFNSK